MERLLPDTLRAWHAKVIAMDLAYKRMERADKNSGMYVLYRDEYNRMKAECDEIDAYIANCGLTGYEEYVLRLRFQEAMRATTILGKFRIDCGENKSISEIERILNSALYKLGVTKNGKLTEFYAHRKKRPAIPYNGEKLMYAEDELTLQSKRLETEADTDIICNGYNENGEYVDFERDIYGNPILPVEVDETEQDGTTGTADTEEDAECDFDLEAILDDLEL